MNTYNRKPLTVLVVWLGLAALVALATACSPATEPSSITAPKQAPGGLLEQDAPPTPAGKTIKVPDQASLPTIERTSQEDCPGVDSQLYQIIQAPDPQELARQFLVEIEDNKIHVLLVLADQDIAFLKDYDVQAGSQYGTRVQAFVPVNRLCELANTDRVLAIVRLDKGIAQ